MRRSKMLIGSLFLSGTLLFGNVVAQQKPSAEAVLKADEIPTPREALKTARTIHVDSYTDFLQASLLEKKLMDHPEFEQWGLHLTSDFKQADLLIEVHRSVFTTSFVYRVVEPRSGIVLITDKCNSLFGTASGKIADNFIQRLKKVRPLPPKAAHPATDGQ